MKLLSSTLLVSAFFFVAACNNTDASSVKHDTGTPHEDNFTTSQLKSLKDSFVKQQPNARSAVEAFIAYAVKNAGANTSVLKQETADSASGYEY